MPVLLVVSMVAVFLLLAVAAVLVVTRSMRREGARIDSAAPADRADRADRSHPTD